MQILISVISAFVNVLNCNMAAHAFAAAGCKLASGACTTWDYVPQEFEGVVM